MENDVITVAFRKDGAWHSERRPYARVLESFKKDIDIIPQYVKALKEADSEKWGKLFQDLAAYAESNPEFAKTVRMREKNGQLGLSVGEPNWFWIPLFLSFVGGVAMGSCINSCASK